MSRNSSAHDLQPSKAELVISKGWVQGVALVFVFGFFVMGFLAYRTYSDGMPQPQRVVSESGDVVFTGEEITAGQKTFRHRGLQQYGSILGYLTAAFADRNTGMTVVAATVLVQSAPHEVPMALTGLLVVAFGLYQRVTGAAQTCPT